MILAETAVRLRAKKMKTVHAHQFAYALSVTTLFLIPFIGWTQNPFPEGPVRDTVVQVCSQCHPLTRIIDGDLRAEEWEATLYDMISRGAPLHEEDLELVRKYLVDNFAVGDQ